MGNTLVKGGIGYNNSPVGTAFTSPIQQEGVRTIVLDPDHADGYMDNTTLDLAVAAVSGITGDKAINYDRVVVLSGTIATGNTTLTIGDGNYVGQVWELALAGAMTTSDIVLTVTSVMGGSGTITCDAATEGAILRWNGYCWNIIDASVVS